MFEGLSTTTRRGGVSSLAGDFDSQHSSRPVGGASLELADVSRITTEIEKTMARVIEGKPEAIRLAITVMLAEGHLLIEDVPGVGKTMLAKALAKAVSCSVKRVQFTPDLLPSDITGVSIYNNHTHEFEFKPGAVFANIVLGDEINRASPKTQSALLECMEERQVTADGTTYALDAPFMVIATQNPADMEGAYPLPEAQRDRFTARLSMGYPSPASELAMLDGHGEVNPLDSLHPATDAATIIGLCAAVRGLYIAAPIKQYAVDLVAATRSDPHVRLGASPRATLHLIRTARAHAALSGRDYVIPEDLAHLAVPVLAHRLILTPEAHLHGTAATEIINRALSRTPIPAQQR